jgi:hypothetical protein
MTRSTCARAMHGSHRRAASAALALLTRGGVAPVLAVALATCLSVVVGPGAAAAEAQTSTFTFTGTQQDYVVPPGATKLLVVAVGGSGGASEAIAGGSPSRVGGLGARVTGVITVVPGSTLGVVVGGDGTQDAGGFNGGAFSDPLESSARPGGGGGATDVRTVTCGSSCPGSTASLMSRLIVAGGGGGAGASGDLVGPGIPERDGGRGGRADGDGEGSGYANTGGVGGQRGRIDQPGAGGSGNSPSAYRGAPYVGLDGTLGSGGAGGQGRAADFGRGAPGAGGGAGGGVFGGGGGGGATNFAKDESDNLFPVGGGGGGGGASLIPAGGSEDFSATTPSVTITPLIDLPISNSFSPTTIPVNGWSTLSFTIHNPAGNATLSGVAFTDDLPAGLVVADPNGLTGTCGGGTITAVAGATSVSLDGATLAADASCTFSVDVTATTAGVKNNSVTVSSTEGGTGDTSNATLTVVAPPSLTEAFGAASVPLHGSTSLTFTVDNPNAATALTGLGFTDPLPGGLIVATPSDATTTCATGTLTATPGSSTVTVSGGALPAGADCTFSVNVTGTGPGAKVNTTSTIASVEGGSGAPASATLTVVGPPHIDDAFGEPSIAFGASTILTFDLTNPNAGAALDGVAFTDTLPAGLVVATPNGLSGSCGGGTITASAGSPTVSLTGATLAAGGGCMFSVNVTAVALGAQQNTTSAPTSTEGGAGSPASASVTVVKAPTTVTLTAPSSARFGAPIAFTAVVAPAQPNGSGVSPTGTVSFFLDGQATPAATAPLAVGRATFTISGLGAGSHTVVALYSGDQFFNGSTSPPATFGVSCGTALATTHQGSLTLAAGTSTCLVNAHVTGSLIVHAGASVDIEGSTIDGPIDASGPSAFRLCGSNVGGTVSVSGATGFVLVGDLGDDGCAPNRIGGSLLLNNNIHGLEAIGNHVSGAVSASGNSGPGPFPGNPGPIVFGNGR